MGAADPYQSYNTHDGAKDRSPTAEKALGHGHTPQQVSEGADSKTQDSLERKGTITISSRCDEGGPPLSGESHFPLEMPNLCARRRG
jgi:hypothetical protein